MLTNHSHTHTHHRSAVAVWSSTWRNALLLGRTMGLKGEKDRDVEEGDTFPKSQLTSWDDWLRIITAPFAPNGLDGLTELYFTVRCWSPLLRTRARTHTHTHTHTAFYTNQIHTHISMPERNMRLRPHHIRPHRNTITPASVQFA